MLPDFSRRSPLQERMDQPQTTPAQFERALKDIQWVNRYLGGSKTLINAVQALLQGPVERTLTVLDLGAGSADIPIALVEWGLRHGVSFEVTAVDIQPTAVTYARQQASAYPQIQVIQGDALNLPMADCSVDLAISSMFLHHLDTPEAVRLLQEMARVSRIGFVVNDLERHPMAYYGIWLLATLLGKGPIFRYDAPLSVLRGFTLADALELKNLAGLSSLTITRCSPFRLIFSWRRSPEGIRSS